MMIITRACANYIKNYDGVTLSVIQLLSAVLLKNRSMEIRFQNTETARPCHLLLTENTRIRFKPVHSQNGQSTVTEEYWLWICGM